MRRGLALLALLAVMIAGLGLAVSVRADESSDRSWLVGWVETTISTPDRQIRLGRIDGALSSDVRLDQITIADRKGVWLAIRGVHLVWSRADLLRGKLTVASLQADTIDVTRKPEAAVATEETDAATDFALPELPVAVDVGHLSVATVRLPAEIAGRPTVLSIAGRGRLADGGLDVDLAATRIEPQGGAFTVKTTYGANDHRLTLDLSLAEPQGGFLSTLLALPGEPPIDFSIRGAGPIDTFSADIALAADGRPLMGGKAVTRLDGTDRTFAVDVDGSLEGLLGQGGALTGGGSELHLLARRSPDGAIRLDRARLKTGLAALDAAGAWQPNETGSTLAVDRLAVAWKTATLDLARPTTIGVRDGRVEVPPTTLRLGLRDATTTGTIDVSGSAGRDLALVVTARALPLALSRLVAPDLGADGLVAVDATLSGTRKAPKVAWRVTGEGLTTAQARTAHLPAATLAATGDLTTTATSLDATLRLGREATLVARGRVPFTGDGLALDVGAERLPLAFADGLVPALGARGTLSGTATVAGSLAAPNLTWTVAGRDLSTAQARAARLPTATLAATGALVADVATLDATLRLGRDASVVARGRVPLSGDGLAVDVVADRLPLAFADAAAPGLGARGTLSGTATVAGSRAEPSGTWKISGTGLSVAATRDAGVAALTLGADGRLDPTATTVTATLSAGDRLRLTADGRVPFDGGDLAMRVAGSASLALVDAVLRERGTRVTGRATLDVSLAGPHDAPRATGTVAIADGTVADPETAMKISRLGALVRLDGDRVTIERFEAATGRSGRIAVRGTVGLGAGLPADVGVTLDAAELTLGETARSEVGGSLRLTGPLATGPTLSGRLALGRTEITIPERFAANATGLGVENLAAPPEVRRTLALAKPKARAGKGKAAAPWRAGLDITVDAPSKLFVRGRGIDAELGGTVRVTGTTDAVIPVGAFQLRRGALDVIGRHIALDKGTVTLTGDLDPTIDFRATSSSRSVSVVAEVTGRASDPALVLTSAPQLPQDEVLSQFLFGRGIADLTGFQLVQLATAAAQLAGGPAAPDLLAAIRKSTGLDTLATTTDSKGNAGLQAGRYIGDRIFLGVTAGAGGSTDATVDLDVTRNLKLRGQAGTDGSKAGFVFEKEY